MKDGTHKKLEEINLTPQDWSEYGLSWRGVLALMIRLEGNAGSGTDVWNGVNDVIGVIKESLNQGVSPGAADFDFHSVSLDKPYVPNQPECHVYGYAADLAQFFGAGDGMSQVNHPVHYNTGAIEVIDAIHSWKLNFALGCVVKYVARCDYKGVRQQDLEKALWYLEYELEVTVNHIPSPFEKSMPYYIPPLNTIAIDDAIREWKLSEDLGQVIRNVAWAPHVSNPEGRLRESISVIITEISKGESL